MAQRSKYGHSIGFNSPAMVYMEASSGKQRLDEYFQPMGLLKKTFRYGKQ